MAVYAYQGVDPQEPSEETRLRWERGKLDQEWVVANKLAPTYGEENLVREKAVPWPATGLPLGELHVDCYVASENLPIEVKSHFNGEVMDSDILQLAGEIHFDPEAGDIGGLIIVDRDLHVDAIPVHLTDDLRAQVEETASTVVKATKTGMLPDRCCSRPSEGIGRMCPFIAECFADWEAPAAISLQGEVATLLPRLHAAEEDVKAKNTIVAAAKEARDELRAEALDAGLEPGDHENAGYRVRLTEVKARVTFRRELAVKAGIWTDADEDRFAPFVKVGDPSYRWKVERLDGAALDPDDFGSDAPWTDADLDAA